jgi:23S rRNA (uracil1939-C5)-methyltransferase
MRKKKILPIIENLEIIDTGSEGQAIGKTEGMVVFVPKAVPGDIIDVQLTHKKKNFAEGKTINIRKKSDYRIEPKCSHFNDCGGCKWQNFEYSEQVKYKEKHALDSLTRIGKAPIETIEPIAPSSEIFYYRNKLDYGFTNKRWLYDFEREEQENGKELNLNALGFHIPGRFDKIFNVVDCKLQPEYSNEIRNSVYEFALKNNFSFFDLKQQEGLLRSLIIRNNLNDEWMVIVAFHQNEEVKINALMEHIKANFPKVVSLFYVINPKRNDTIFDLDLKLYHGVPHLIETLNGLKFKIHPKSFFQTNPKQTHTLYSIACDYAELTGNELVYDLYTGTGTIANYMAPKAKKVVGIEYVEDAIIDARENSRLNNISNTVFYAGDMKDVLTAEFVEANGKPDVIITDPPRAGMHESVINRIIEIKPKRIVYVSCNPATQARDIALLEPYYRITKSRAVDMFPHTQHVENVLQLVLK